jgi:hypothetical protein
MISYYFWLFVILVISYLLIVDLNILDYLNLLVRFSQLRFQRFQWWIWHNPSTPWARYFMWHRAMKIAEELMNENKMERRSDAFNNDSKTSK